MPSRLLAPCLFILGLLGSSLLFFLYLYPSLSTEPPPKVAQRTSVVLITFDTMRSDHLSLHGYPRTTTPTLDSLARHAGVFNNAMSPIPLTYAAHVSILSGLEPANHGVLSNPDPIPAGIPMLPSILAARGYRTAAVVSGRTLHSRLTDLSQHFHHYEDSFRGEERNAELTTTTALKVLATIYRDPFFLWVHYFDPHADYAPPRDAVSSYYPGHAPETFVLHSLIPGHEARGLLFARPEFQDRLIAQYDGELAFADRWFGSLLDELVRRNLFEDLLLVVTADHGEGLTERGGLFDHSEYLHHAALAVPLLVKPPRWHHSRRINQVVGLIDLAPTILDYLEIEANPAMQGQSLRTLLEDNPSGWQELYYAKLFRGWENTPLQQQTVAVRRRNEKAILTYLNDNRTGSRRTMSEELYLLDLDPGETRDLAATQPQLLTELRTLAEHWEAGRDHQLPREAPPLPPDEHERLRSLGYLQ
ncbi:MAG: hypothetical protein A2284_03640 [Deltaproteobacteria bacterium RIFOXYA12_FULL_61_11]|nr:MAG: hypothetical protein A2284_03640 [Deltaproteobacteria bacterium RIFOXYA12_FULL_61_11]